MAYMHDYDLQLFFDETQAFDVPSNPKPGLQRRLPTEDFYDEWDES